MTMQLSYEVTGAAAGADSIDDRRRASWLHRPYSALSWVISDTRDVDKTAIIDFDYVLPDGRKLCEADRLYRTVKEYAWWVRDPRHSRIDDAATHQSLVRNMMHLAHSLSLRNLQSFAQLQPFDIEELIEDCRFGLDAVIRGSERMSEFLNRVDRENVEIQKPYGGLPQYKSPNGIFAKNIHSSVVVKDCNLPSSAIQLPRVSGLIRRAAVGNGFTLKDGPPAELPPLKNLTSQALQRWLEPIEQLFAMRRRMEAEAIPFRPFPNGAGRIAAFKGIGPDRTPTAPPRLVIHLIEHSVRWLFDKAASIEKRSAGPKAVRLMATACWIIIAAFTARRVEEINDLRDDCVRGDNEAGWWLQVYIEKTLQRKEWIPVPSMVIRAVEMLRIISEEARLETGSDILFQWLNPEGKSVSFDVGRNLDNFSSLVNVPFHTPRQGEPIVWHWNPHQFRRFFAVLYFYRYEAGSIEVLSHHLRHFSLEMTRRYVTEDPEVAALWTDTEWGYMGHVARTIVSGERSVAGSAGERLKKTAKRFIDMFRRKLRIVTPERVGASVVAIMQRQGLVLTPKPWVTCTCPRTKDAARKAACRVAGASNADAVGPDFAQAGPTVCSGCPFAMTEGQRQPFVDAEVQHLEAAVVAPHRAGTIFGELEAARVLEIRSARDTRYAAAKPLQGVAFDEEALI